MQEARERLIALANLIERPPHDDVLLEKSVALTAAGDIRILTAPQALARRDGVEERVNSGHGSVYDRLLTFIHDRDDALRGDEGTSPDEIDETVLTIMRITGSHPAPADPRPDPLEALREAREALVYYSKAEAYGRRIILNVEVMYDRGKKARQAIANIKALMGEAE
jgi:hypothetical protein